MEIFYNFIYGNTGYWAFLGTLYLIYLTVQDYRKDPVTGSPRMMVDDRLNFFMMGSTFALLSHIKRPIWFILFLVILVVALGWFLRRYNLVGFADIKTMGWIFYGLAIMNIQYLIMFSVFFSILTGLYAALKFFVFKRKEATPFYPVLLISFLLVAIINNLYRF